MRWIKMCIFTFILVHYKLLLLHITPLVFIAKISFFFFSTATRIVKMKNYYANDNIMRITCEHGTNLLHIIGWWMRIVSHNKKLRRLGDLYLKWKRCGTREKQIVWQAASKKRKNVSLLFGLIKVVLFLCNLSIKSLILVL